MDLEKPFVDDMKTKSKTSVCSELLLVLLFCQRRTNRAMHASKLDFSGFTFRRGPGKWKPELQLLFLVAFLKRVYLFLEYSDQWTVLPYFRDIQTYRGFTGSAEIIKVSRPSPHLRQPCP